MKVLFLRSGYGKPDSRLEKEIVTLVEAGHYVDVCAWDRDSYSDKTHVLDISGHDIQYHHIGIESILASGFRKNLSPMIKFNIKLMKYLKCHGSEYDVVHASDFDTVVPAYLYRKKKHFKLVYDIYDYYADSHHMPHLLDKFVRKFDTEIINKSDAVILCNEKRISQIVPAKPAKISVIHNSPENHNVIPDYDTYPRNNRLRIVFIGAFTATGRYIKEMVEVISQRKDVELLIGGYGYKPVEDFIVGQEKNSDSIVFVGKQEYSRVLEIEATADVLIALYDPSLRNHQYAAPNKFYEALMLGKPLICAKNTCIDEIIAQNDIGWILDVPDKAFQKEFNRILDEIVAKRSDLLNYCERMKQLYDISYDWDVMKEQLKKLYVSL